ncbi:glycoprotein [Durham virus]|uniref:Glycoprotein n=1 Tax=Durham virus TaxID=710545 RepID=D6C4E8_9RHAB|nr:glycoprotein [Durham virus]ADB88756.1 glycoprotein [Durham virus]
MWIILLHVSFVASQVIIAPLREPQEWRVATKSDFKCTPGMLDDIEGPIDFWRVSTIKADANLHIEGYACQAEIWISKCEETWYFSKTITHSVQFPEGTQHSCQDELRKQKAEGAPVFRFPDVECAYASTTTATSYFLRLTPMNVELNPYASTLLHPSFRDGKCTDLEVCPMLHHHGLWIPKEPIAKTEEQAVFEKVTIKYKLSYRHSKAYGYISGPAVPFSDLRDACKIKFAGTAGMRLGSGMWISLGGDHEQGGLGWSSKHTTNIFNDLQIDDCAPGTKVSVPHAGHIGDLLEIKMNHMAMQFLCLDALRNVFRENSTSRLDLAKLSPSDAGEHPVYQLSERGIEVGITMYGLINWAPDARENRLGYHYGTSKAEGKNPITWKRWTRTQDGKLNGPNGVYQSNNTIVHPNLALLGNLIMEDLAADFDLDPIKEPEVTHYDANWETESIGRGEDTRYMTHRNRFFFWGPWNSLKNILLASIITLIALITSTLLLCCVCKKRQHRSV